MIGQVMIKYDSGVFNGKVKRGKMLEHGMMESSEDFCPNCFTDNLGLTLTCLWQGQIRFYGFCL